MFCPQRVSKKVRCSWFDGLTTSGKAAHPEIANHERLAHMPFDRFRLSGLVAKFTN